MGQIASDGVNNLAYYSSKPHTTVPQQQSKLIRPAFNASKTYVSLVIGDGDSIKHMKRWTRIFLLDRVQRCKLDPSPKGCFPLLWTLSPNLRYLAPDWLRWYYDQARQTTHDYFVLPPSGDLYSYPAEMQPSDQVRFVANTERDGLLMNTSAMVEWEMLDTWPAAVREYFPRYSARGIVRSLFLVNVPYMFPVWLFKSGEFYHVLDGKEGGHPIVIFKPREWRGASSNTSKPTLAVPAMAKEINGCAPPARFKTATLLSRAESCAYILKSKHYFTFCWSRYPPGTATAIYMTTDGGLLPADDKPLHNPYDLVAQLAEHVEVVDHEALVEFALRHHRTAAQSRPPPES